MKIFVPGERFEERGNPMRWFWLLMGALWLMQVILRVVNQDWGLACICGILCAVLSLANFTLHTRYILIADETGVTWRYGLGNARHVSWDGIARVVDRMTGSFTKSAGLYLYPADAPEKAVFLGPRSELQPIVMRYLPMPIEQAG